MQIINGVSLATTDYEKKKKIKRKRISFYSNLILIKTITRYKTITVKKKKNLCTTVTTT